MKPDTNIGGKIAAGGEVFNDKAYFRWMKNHDEFLAMELNGAG